MLAGGSQRAAIRPIRAHGTRPCWLHRARAIQIGAAKGDVEAGRYDRGGSGSEGAVREVEADLGAVAVGEDEVLAVVGGEGGGGNGPEEALGAIG